MKMKVTNTGKDKKSKNIRPSAKAAEKPRRTERSENTYNEEDRFALFMDDDDLDVLKDDYFKSNYGYSESEERKRTSKQNTKRNDKANSKAKEDEYKAPPRPRVHLTREQLKFRRTLRYVTVFLITVGVAVFFSFQLLFRTSEIKVENSKGLPYTDAQIIEASGLKLKENIFTSKKKLAVKKITEKFPYIENAAVSFKIPATQIITVEPAVASYSVAVSEGYAKISANARVLEITPEQDTSIPLLRGLKMTNASVGEYITFEKAATKQILGEVIASIHENNVPNIFGIDISNAAGIKLNYDNRITILLGLPEDVGYKLKTAMTIINTELTAADRGDLDVSLANGNRKASYFTPVTTNTVSAVGASSQTSQASSKTDDDYDTPTTLRPVISQAETSDNNTNADNTYNNDDNEEENYYDDYYYEDEYGNDYYEYEEPDLNNNYDYEEN